MIVKLIAKKIQRNLGTRESHEIGYGGGEGKRKEMHRKIKFQKNKNYC